MAATLRARGAPHAHVASAATRVAVTPIGFRADIQSLRGIAVLLVVLYHAGTLLPRGFLGVDMFFAISGFVITAGLVHEHATEGAVRLGAFYARRVRRLLPALAVMVGVVAVAGVVAAPFEAQPLAAATAASAALFGSNIYLAHLSTGYFAVQTSLDPLLHTWTLGVEEQFYVIFPLLLVLVLRSRRAATALAGVLAVCLVSFDLFMLGSGDDGPGRLAFYGSPARAWEFGLGALTALAVVHGHRLSRRVAFAVGATGLVLAFAAVFSSTTFPIFLNGRTGMMVLGTCALMLAGSTAAVPFASIVAVPPLVALGALSYSWYLWHWPCIVYARAMFPHTGWAPQAAALLSLVPAWCSYRLVEGPIRRSRRPAKGIAVVCIAASLAAAGLLGLAHTALGHDARFSQIVETQRLHADVTHGCDAANGLTNADSEPCIWGSAAEPVVALVGDSNAGHFSEPVANAARGLGFRSFVWTHSSCPFADVVLDQAGSRGLGRHCLEFVNGVVARLARVHPRLVIVSSRVDDYIDRPDTDLADPTGSSPLATTPAAKEAAFARGVARIAARFTRAGIPVLLVQPVPRMALAPDSCATVLVLTDRCVAREDRIAVDAELARSIAANRAVAARNSAVSTVSFVDQLCNETACATRSRGRENYRDEDHLSVAGALALTPEFARLIQAMRYAAPTVLPPGAPRAGGTRARSR